MKRLVYRSQFKKDVKRCKKAKKDFQKFKEIALLLESNKQLPRSFYDHKLKGHFKERRECHLSPDWILIYKCELHQIIFERMGSHTELFQ